MELGRKAGGAIVDLSGIGELWGAFGCGLWRDGEGRSVQDIGAKGRSGCHETKVRDAKDLVGIMGGQPAPGGSASAAAWVTASCAFRQAKEGSPSGEDWVVRVWGRVRRLGCR